MQSVLTKSRFEMRSIARDVLGAQVWGVFDTFIQAFVPEKRFGSQAGAIYATGRMNQAYERKFLY